ncbi:MAG: iron-containing alcohol dehydrogenase [Clostridiales bacterium]|nr:iron-containing alcohol dehydrogenase [Clostridiales bacterium]
MQNFFYDIDTHVHFGKGQIEQLGRAVRRQGRRALLVYGGGSIKKSGLYDEAMKSLSEAGVSVAELSGVEPNPRVATVAKGVQICREQDVEVVVPIGGGSSIDCAKVIAGAAFYEGDPWDLVTGQAAYTEFLPIVAVLTLAATGSEMDAVAVISNPDSRDKLGTRHPAMRPKAAIMDPSYTFSVSPYQTAAGTADIMSHVMENYFWHDVGAHLQDRMAEALLKTCLKYGEIACSQPDNYEARANLMWAGSHAINGLISLGKAHPWSVHPIEHPLSAYYDITHGAGLAILTPAWMRQILNGHTVDKFVDFAVNVFGLAPGGDKFATAQAGIDALYGYFKNRLRLPMTLSEVGIDERHFDAMAEKAVAGGLDEAYQKLDVAAVKAIYTACR